MSESNDRERVEAFIRSRNEMLDSDEPLNYFEFLGAPLDGTSEAITRAYFQACKQIHPDRLDRLGITELTQEAGRVFQTLNEGHQVLSDVERRFHYLKALESRGPEEDEVPPEEQARIFTHRAQLMIKKRGYEQAEGFLEMALEKHPEDVEAKALLAEAIYNNSKRSQADRLKGAKVLLDQVLRENAHHARALYLTSMYFKAKGDLTRQKRFLDSALLADSELVDARRELRLLSLRKGGGAVRFLRKFLKIFSGSDSGSKPTSSKRSSSSGVGVKRRP